MENRGWIKNNIIEVEQVSKKYPMGEVWVTALDSISLDVTPADFLVELLRSISAKTTLLNLIGALDIASSIYICVDGQHLRCITLSIEENKS